MRRIGKLFSKTGRPRFFKGSNVGNVSRNIKQKIQKLSRTSGILGFGKINK